MGSQTTHSVLSSIFSVCLRVSKPAGGQVVLPIPNCRDLEASLGLWKERTKHVPTPFFFCIHIPQPSRSRWQPGKWHRDWRCECQVTIPASKHHSHVLREPSRNCVHTGFDSTLEAWQEPCVCVHLLLFILVVSAPKQTWAELASCSSPEHKTNKDPPQIQRI